MRKTHTNETIVEKHIHPEGGHEMAYPVKRRAKRETDRLMRLVERLDHRKVFKYSTGTPIIVPVYRNGREVGTRPNPNHHSIERHVIAATTVEAAAAGRAAMGFI